jgi:hypothetical protein
MNCGFAIFVSLILTQLLSPNGFAQGKSPTNAIPIKLPVHEISWVFSSRPPDERVVPLKKPGDVVWYTFDLEDDLVILAQHYGTRENQANVEILDKSLNHIAPEPDSEFDRLVCNEELKNGTYFVKVTSIATNGQPFKIGLCKFPKLETNGPPDPAKVYKQFGNFTSSQLVGQWRCVDLIKKLTTNITFNQDGTYSATVESPGHDRMSMSGKWNLKQDTVSYVVTSCSDTNVPVGATDTDQIFEISSNRFATIITLDLETFVRIK